MREIKFRAWYESSKEMIHSDDREYVFVVLSNGRVQVYLADGDEMLEMDTDPGEQFSGMHDKAGQEIWEGDIVRCSSQGINYNNDEIIGKVVFADGCFEVEFAPVWDVTSKVFRTRLYVKCFVVNRDIEVIGNVHEGRKAPTQGGAR